MMKQPMSRKQPDISVLMPAYNTVENYRPGMLKWVVEQTLRLQPGVSVELCIVDDASTDDTPDLLAQLGDRYPQIIYTHHRTNQGVAGALNSAAELARGRYFIVQSVRSWYEPGCFKVLVDALEARPEIGFVYGMTQYHGVQQGLHIPPPFRREDFFRHFVSLFGYLYRREAWERGCRYQPYLQREGRSIDVSDYDFVMQLIVKLKWEGLALREQKALHYLYSGEGQMTNLVHKYQREINQIFAERWGAA